jgi:Putative metal-binding motif/Secretion system C-terminal sorting domain
MQKHLLHLFTGFCLFFAQNLLTAQSNGSAVWYRDADADGYGRPTDTLRRATAPPGYAGTAGDCNDADPAVNPGAREICNNGLDDNCNGTADEDTTPPVAACTPYLEMDIDSTGVRRLKTSDIDNGSFDACTTLFLRLDRNELTCADTGLQVVTLFLRDAAGNTNFCEGRIKVKNAVAFKSLCRPSITLYRDADGVAQLLPAQVDARSCGAADTIYLSRTRFICADSALQSVILTLKKRTGDSSQCRTTVVLKDSLAPHARCKPAVDLFLDEQGTAVLKPEQIDNGSADACAPVRLSLDKTDFDCNTGRHTAVLFVRDTAGNLGVCQSAVTLRDTFAPRALCASGISVFLNAKGEALLLPSRIDAGSDDACGIAVAALNRARFFCKDLGNQTIVLSVSDNNGNRGTCAAVVHIRDTIAPQAVCREKINLPLDPSGAAVLTSDLLDAGSSDACTPIATRSLSRGTFSCADLGRQIVTLTVRDSFGNAATCNTTVSVIDLVVPTAQCRPDLILNLNEQGEAILRPQDLNGGSADPCGMDSLWVSRSRFNCADLGVQRVILFVSDGSGNRSACQATINIVDPIPPVARCRNDVPIFLGPTGQTTINLRDLDLFSNDNCGTVVLSTPRQILTCADTGFQILRLFVADAAGNVKWCESSAWVFDTTDTDRDGVVNCADACPDDPKKYLFTAYYKDADGDGKGAGAPVFACAAPVGTVENNKDCNDDDPIVLCPNVPGPIGDDNANNEDTESRSHAPTEASALKLYPDPAKETLTIAWSGSAPRQIAVFDLTGRLLKTSAPGGNKVVLEIENFPIGVYVARIQWQDGKTEARSFRKTGN